MCRSPSLANSTYLGPISVRRCRAADALVDRWPPPLSRSHEPLWPDHLPAVGSFLLESVGWDQRANRTRQYSAANGSSIAPPSRSGSTREQLPLPSCRTRALHAPPLK